MRKSTSRRFGRGFTLVEMLVVVVILGLILGLMGLEFSSVVSTTLHNRANLDAEAMARVASSKVVNEMRLAAQDTTDGLAQPAVVQPAAGAGATPGPIAEFYEVQHGSLAQAIRTCSDGSPCPPFDDVIIQINPKVPGELDEIITPVGKVANPPLILATNVTGFTITPPLSDKGTQWDVTITVSAPSTHCVSKVCTFTLTHAVYVGGTNSQ